MKVWLLALALLVSPDPPPATAAPAAAPAVAAYDGDGPPPDPYPGERWVKTWHYNRATYRQVYYWEPDPVTGEWGWQPGGPLTVTPDPAPTDPGLS